jgi:plastocyanin
MRRRTSSAGILTVAVGIAASCGTRIDSGPKTVSLLDPSQVIASDPSITIGASGVNPQTLHVDAPVTVRFTNSDAVAHTLEPAPELKFDNCPEFNQLGTLEPGQAGSTTFKTTVVICAFHDAANPTNRAFQGLVVVH